MEVIDAADAAKLEVIRLSIDNASRMFFFREASNSDRAAAASACPSVACVSAESPQ